MATQTTGGVTDTSFDVEGSLVQIVEKVKEKLVKSLRDNGRYATGTTESQLIIESDATSAKLTAPAWFYALQDGRKPTSPGAPKGDPSLFEQIEVWCAAKGIDQAAAYAITQKIHKEGYDGTPGIIDEPLSQDNIDSAMAEVLGELSDLFTVAVANSINTAAA